MDQPPDLWIASKERWMRAAAPTGWSRAEHYSSLLLCLEFKNVFGGAWSDPASFSLKCCRYFAATHFEH